MTIRNNMWFYMEIHTWLCVRLETDTVLRRHAKMFRERSIMLALAFKLFNNKKRYVFGGRKKEEGGMEGGRGREETERGTEK